MGVDRVVKAAGSRDAEPLPPRREGVPEDAAGVLRVTLEAEVPEVLFHGMRRFLDSHPQWDQYSLISSALAGFLFQNGCQETTVTQHYLDALFLRT